MKNQKEIAPTVLTLGRGKNTRRFDVNTEGQIPDLWHIAHAEPDLRCRQAILETWHLAHDMQRALADLVMQRNDLLEACKAFAAIEKSCEGKGLLDLSVVDLQEAYNQARAAIAKAGGAL